MTTYERDPVIATLAARASDQVHAGVKAIIAGDLLRAEVLFRAALATLSSLESLLDGTAQKPPLRVLAIVGKGPSDDAA